MQSFNFCMFFEENVSHSYSNVLDPNITHNMAIKLLTLGLM
uniref:Uncharacterized protein n=1 Tax=Anguilla anguilla TaxID=7936 RepID=A0A0E9VCQ9_ANGAN